MAVKHVAELGRDDPFLTVARDRVADERFACVRAVALCGVDEVDPPLACRVEHAVDFILRKVFPPLAAELPRSHADDRDAKIGLTQTPVFHAMLLRSRL